MRIWREKPGVISPGPIWVSYHAGYLYTHHWLIGLLWLMLTEWNNDAHLCG